MSNSSANVSNNSGIDEGQSLGDPESWLDLYGDILFRYAYSKLRNRETAEDLVQETFLAAMRTEAKYTGQGSAKGWFISILKNKIIDHFRKSSKWSSEPLPEVETLKLVGMNDFGIWNQYVANWARGPESILEDGQFLAKLKECVSSLPSKAQTLLQVYLMGSLSKDEICKQFNISTSNYWVLLHRARINLRSCLEKNWYNAK